MVCVQALLAEVAEGVLADVALGAIVEHHVLRACQLTACCLPYIITTNFKHFTYTHTPRHMTATTYHPV